MKPVMYCIIISWIICVPGCNKDSSETQKALEKAEKAEQKAIALQEALSNLKNEKTEEDLNRLQIENEHAHTKDDLNNANQALADLEVEKNNLEHKLKEATSTVKYLREQLSAKDRDIRELDQLNQELSKALEQLETELQSYEVRIGSHEEQSEPMEPN
jgi:chromosome segregation ATPase